MKVLTSLANGIGKGLVAGFVGTVAMTVSSTLEQKIRGRPASSAPAKAAEKALGIKSFENEAAEQRFSNLVHWGYGTGWGVVRGLLRTLGASPAAATAGHFAAVWGGSPVTLPSLGVTPPVTTWEKEEIVIDVWHHIVYAAATGIAYESLEAR